MYWLSFFLHRNSFTPQDGSFFPPGFLMHPIPAPFSSFFHYLSRTHSATTIGYPHVDSTTSYNPFLLCLVLPYAIPNQTPTYCTYDKLLVDRPVSTHPRILVDSLLASASVALVLYPKPHIPSGSKRILANSEQIQPNSYHSYQIPTIPTILTIPTIPTRFLPHSYQIPTRFQPHSYLIPTRFQPHSNQIPTRFRPYSNHKTEQYTTAPDWNIF